MMEGSARTIRKLPVTVCSHGGPPEAARAEALAERLALPVRAAGESPAALGSRSARSSTHRAGGARGNPHRSGNGGWQLLVLPHGLELLGPSGERTAPRFTDGRAASHAREHDLAAQPLARALGIAALGARLQRTVTLLDATAGFGTDAWLAASLGARVIMLERNQVIHALLEDALERAHRDGDDRARSVASRLSLRLSPRRADDEGDDESDGESDAWPASVDVVYLDPMYPERRVRGGQRKQIEALQAIVGHDADNDTLLDRAVQRARVRVVVKRPRGADPLHSETGYRPNDAIHAPNTRYDRYPGRSGADPARR